MAFANEYRQYYPQSAYPAEQYASSVGNAAATQAAYDANQQRLAAQQAWQAQQQASSQNTYANRAALEKELAAIDSEIRSLQLELEGIRSEGGYLDSTDRKLAANRAAIGDFGNSRAHQADIVNRQNVRDRRAEAQMQWRWQSEQNRLSREADQKKQAQADIRRILGEIEDIDAQIPYHTEIGAQNALKAKRNRLVSELASYGVSTPAENYVGNQGTQQVQDSVATLVQDEASSTDKKGLFLDADKRAELADRYEKLGLKAEAKRVRNTLTVPEYKAKADKLKKEKEEARKIVGKYQQMTPVQFAAFAARWNRNDPNDAEIKLLRKHATFDGQSAPVMK